MSHPLQTTAWAKLRESQGHRPYWIGKCLMLVKPVNFPFKSFGVMSQVDLNELSLSSLKALAKELKLSHVQIDPQNYTSDKVAWALLDKLGQKRKAESLVPRFTSVIDLTLSEEQLMANLHKKTRRFVKRALEAGIETVEMSNSAGLDIFYQLYSKTVAKKKFFGRSHKYMQAVWERMSNAGLAKIFVAYYNKEPVAARLVFIQDKKIYNAYAGNSRQHSDLNVAHGALWQLIVWAKQHGFIQMDMWGVDPNSKPGDADFGYSQFKLGFGGEVVEFLPAYDYIISPIYYILFKLGNSLRLFMLRAKAKLR